MLVVDAVGLEPVSGPLDLRLVEKSRQSFFRDDARSN